MDSNQRLQNLQKACADIILNASKEADAKAMTAERKAQRLEHELQVTNNDKISEAKMTSRNQTSEDYKQSQFPACHPLELENGSLVAADKENLDLNQRAEYPECLEAIRIRNLYGPVPELPSILLKSKEYNFNRNGCTHGKAKFEGDLSTCKATTDGAAKMLNIASNRDSCISCSLEVQTFDLILTAAKTAINTKYRKKKLASSTKIPERLFRKLHETPVVTQSDPSKTSDYNQPVSSPSAQN
ncbi:hypothetical protein POM88_051053 [Heracleum sosnowskyi]|uniref:Uncharacterized protein n=1 Tax=Heracleum sosnowskyi TaxID=360622 RepID=A0AAD8M337_9APIA|nr:hypothetical protein POM88_051053 [Heracleum sosnowskyi]